MQATQYARKLEKNGRLMIPIELRKQMNMVPSKEYSFYTCVDDGRKFICIDCGPEIDDAALKQAIQIIQESGMKIVQNDD